MSEKANRADSILVKRMVVHCVRNTVLEDWHAGSGPVTNTGDYSDVKVVDANGTEWAWNDCSHIDQAQMKALMQQVVDRMYTFLKAIEHEESQEFASLYDASISRWATPKIDRRMMGKKLATKLYGSEA